LEDSRLKIWETLFQRALQVMDSAYRGVFRPDTWSFGGGTVLMRRYDHRFSKDIDIFVPDPQYLGYVDPDKNDAVAELTSKFIKQDNFLKLYFPEGEVDFVVSLPLTKEPTTRESIFNREVRVETSAEILAKKIKYRGAEITARDIFDFALIAEKEPEALKEISVLIRATRDAIRTRIAARESTLRKTFAELEIRSYRRTYDECISIVNKALNA
jgi:predicted nucleotidyltransferase component of viral defense system